MGFLDYFKFGKAKGPGPIAPAKGPGHQIFSTPFLRVGEGNLSTPYIDRYYTQNNIIRFGTDNLYPQLLNQLYYTSPIHGTCIEFITNAVIGGGYSWADKRLSAEDTVQLMTFEKANRFTKMARVLTRDYTMHRRVVVLVTKLGNGTRLTRIDPATIRNGLALEVYTYSFDWSRGMIESATYPRYFPGCDYPESLYVFQDDTPGQDVYPLPGYNSILNFAFLDGEMSFFHKNHIQNSIFPSLAIRRPKEFGSIEEINRFKEEITSKQGASNAGKVIVLTGNGMEDVPELTAIPVNSADGAFTNTSKEIKEQICIAHGINPSIMGVKTQGQLGGTTELQDSYAIFEKNRVMPERATMQEILNELVDCCGVMNHLVINNFQIIEQPAAVEQPEVELKIGKRS